MSGVATAAEAPVRLLLSIGSDLGNPDEAPLQHAEDDAQRMRDLFVELGSVDAARALVLKRATATKVTERIAELQGRVAELKAAGRRVELIIFASGHGKGGQLHLTGTALPLEELRTLAKNCGADLTITIVDACESGVASRTKGAAKGPAYALSVQPPSVTGEVFIASSGASESAQEWDVLSGSLFTHHLISGLRGDADTDGDGRVSLMESYAYAERRTVANSVDKGQHPEFAVALEGSSDVVLTALDKGRARVVLDETMEGRFVLVSQPRPDVVTEVTKTRGRVVTLAVPPGRYLLRQARGFSVALQDVELPWGGNSKVDPRRFVTRDFAEVALKGGDVGFHPHALQLIAGIGAPPIEGTPIRWSIGLGYRLTVGQFWASLSAGWGSARFRGVELWTRDNRFAARLIAGMRFWLGPVTLMPGVAVEGSALRQDSVRDDEVEIRRSYPALPIRVTPGFAAGPHLRAEVPMFGPLFAAFSVTAAVKALPLAEGPTWTVGADGDFSLGVRF
ncbi:MAG: caspase family protein [Archangium sp.]